MVRNIIANNPNLDRNEVTLLTETKAAGVTALKAQSTVNLALNDQILIGLPASENAEVRKIATVPNVNDLTITIATGFSHEYDEPIIKLDYNQLKIYRSIDSGQTFTLLATISIDYNSPNSTTEYIDATGTQPYIYRFSYYNSETLQESDQSGDIKLAQTRGYITLEEFKGQTGIKVSDDFIIEAIAYGANNVRRELYAPREYKTYQTNTQHYLTVHPRLIIADTDLSNTPIDKNDFYAYEQADWVNGIPGAVTDVTSDITSVDLTRNVLTFGTSRPTSGKMLTIVWHETWERLKFDTAAEVVAGIKRSNNLILKQLNKLWAVNYIFENVPFHTLQRGISNWSLSGVSVQFDYDVVQKVIEDNTKKIREIITSIEVPYVKFSPYRAPERKDLSEYVPTVSHRGLEYR